MTICNNTKYVAYYEEFQGHSPVEAVDNSCDDVYQGLRKTLELFIENTEASKEKTIAEDKQEND
jgi:hypothetical protein